MKQAIATETTKALPPVAVTVATFEGMAFSDWVYLATFLYVVAQLGYLLWKWYKEYKASK